MLKAFDADGHVDEWEGTFSDEYLEPAFREQRPVVVDADLQGTYFTWNIPGRGLWRVGSSPSSKGGVNSQENIRLAEWRGTLESGEFRSAAARSELLDVENTEIQVNYPTLFLYHPTSLDIPLNQALTRAYNNWISDISNQEPERYKWVTVVDVHDPKEAAKEIFRQKKWGLWVLWFTVCMEQEPLMMIFLHLYGVLRKRHNYRLPFILVGLPLMYIMPIPIMVLHSSICLFYWAFVILWPRVY